MSDALFSALEIDDTDSSRTGYRLHQIEVYNWGTFDKRVWRLNTDGNTSLLTGDIGSGKSTLVDAITTLLLPAQKIAYNKAAGAGSKERSLRSYVEGHYRSERNEATGASRAVGLRGSESYSVILGVFVNEGYDEQVTIAQVLHQKDRTGQPTRFYVTASERLSIEEHFSNFGSELRQLRTRLRSQGADIEDAFPNYSRRMRRLLGVKSEQAMELFHQTVSMKSVGNLNDFVRTHMLEPANAAQRVSTIIDHFENLTRAHEAVQRATAQLAVLDPLIDSADKFDAAKERRAVTEREREALTIYAAERVIEAVDRAIVTSETTRTAAENERADFVARRSALRSQREALQAERAEAGGARLGRLEAELPTAEALHTQRRDRRDRFEALAVTAGIERVSTAAEFRTTIAGIAGARTSTEAEQHSVIEQHRPLVLDHGTKRARVTEISSEIASLEARRNNLPKAIDGLRTQLCQELGLNADELPFVGELIEVDEAHVEWRGAAERVLRSFALTLLVPQAHYARASAWVNSRHLGARLVYLRVPERQLRAQAATTHGGLRLLDVLKVETGAFTDFVTGELARRAEHRLVGSVAELEREDRAVTLEGLVRDRDRHEKDDRFDVSDARRWVLGRSRERKIAALTDELGALRVEVLAVEEQLRELDEHARELAARIGVLGRLEEYTSWEDVDESGALTALENLREEIARLKAGSSQLAEIDRKLTALGDEQSSLEDAITQADQLIGGVNAEIERLRVRRGRETALLHTLDDTVLAAARTEYDSLDSRAKQRAAKTVDELDELRTQLLRQLTGEIEAAQREMNGHSTSLMNRMAEMRRNWPESVSEMDADTGALADYRDFHARVKNDDLPRFESEFKRQLNTETINDLAGFNHWLARQAEEIRGRIVTINEALGAIDYNPGRVIVLVAEPTSNTEIRDFRAELRAATGELLSDGDDLERRFERVRVIVERFKGREGSADADRAWAARVTDVRNWFTFAASERDRETGVVHEHYTDSDGKSGGQKEKLAYTILAASLAYQFGLEWGVKKSKDFRFAVIDEAFGRGSDQSTRYALDLFGKLGLQLLIVTPLQKVHVIEPYVSSIGFVENYEGSASRVYTLTVEEFRKRRAMKQV